jgi:hypothetical protein
MDGCSYLNVEATSYNGQQFLETVNRSLLAVGGKLKTKVLVLYLSSITLPLHMCTKVSVLHYFTLRHYQTTQTK